MAAAKKTLKKYFIVGLLTLLPLFVTIWVLWSLFNALEGIWSHLFLLLVGRTVPGLGFVLSILLILGAGLVATNVLGQKIIRMLEKVMARVPVASLIYSVVKEVITSLSLSSHSFASPVLVEFPREGVHSIGFVTRQSPDGVLGLPEGTVQVFVPTTPNITTGFLLMLPRNKCTFLDLTVEDAMRVVLSAGVLSPERAEKGNPQNLPPRS